MDDLVFRYFWFVSLVVWLSILLWCRSRMRIMVSANKVSEGRGW